TCATTWLRICSYGATPERRSISTRSSGDGTAASRRVGRGTGLLDRRVRVRRGADDDRDGRHGEHDRDDDEDHGTGVARARRGVRADAERPGGREAERELRAAQDPVRERAA